MDATEKVARFNIARYALFLKCGPLRDFPWCVPLGLVRFDPCENFAVAFAGGELLFQGVRVDSEEFERTLVERTGVMVIAVFSGDGGASFVEHARQQSVSAEANAQTSWWALCEIGCVHGWIHQGTACCLLKNPPVGPFSSSVASQ